MNPTESRVLYFIYLPDHQRHFCHYTDKDSQYQKRSYAYIYTHKHIYICTERERERSVAFSLKYTEFSYNYCVYSYICIHRNTHTYLPNINSTDISTLINEDISDIAHVLSIKYTV